MTTPTGIITLADINAEIGASPTASISLNDNAVRYLASPVSTPVFGSPFFPLGSTISMNDLKGRSTQLFASGGNSIIYTPTHVIHVFTSPGTFTVDFDYPTANTVDYLVVGGGGAGRNGGGGGGGFRTGIGLTVTSALINIVTIGAGGALGSSSGSSSSFGPITATGGGLGGTGPGGNGSPGGSGGGGGSAPGLSPSIGGVGNSPPVSPPQGNPGGNGRGGGGGGGGGATTAGTTATNPFGLLILGAAGPGGSGIGINWIPSSYGTPGPSATFRYFSGGGGGLRSPKSTGSGVGGFGGGGPAPTPGAGSGTSGTTNTGGGGGGGVPGSSGGSGIVAIRYTINN